ncbi:MAG: sigma-70 family RNA polymerase sigma factor, partial [Sedimentisphaerales bacterium]|nr:sigma-70 family RNA polymerase sigma factor [Sedimentisphaerales bacterium]
PEKKRRKQLDAAEQLYAIVDKDKEYPFEFVCFRITGFHLKSDIDIPLIKGDELLEDLRIFITKLSGRLAEPVAEKDQKIYTMQELAERMKVSTKTIYRWRKRGLIARKYVFDDGVKRLGFLQSAVDDFLRTNPDLVNHAKDFSRLTLKQRQKIINEAAKLSADTSLSRHQIISKISAKVGKSHETIRYTLLDYEQAHPEKTLFKKSTGAIDPAQAAEIYRLYKQGCSIKELMERYDRNRSSIYRLINQRRAKALLAKKIEFVSSDDFLKEDIQETVLANPLDLEETPERKQIESFELAGEYLLPEYLRILKDTPVLNREREIALFRRYNFLKFLANQARAGMKLSNASGSRLTRIEGYLAEAEEIRRRIVEANLRLVISIAVKHMGAGMDFSELVSKGNFALINALEEFDYTKGFRFGRLASLNIAKEYAKLSGKSVRRIHTKAGSRQDMEHRLRTTLAHDVSSMEKTHRSLAQIITNELNERERYIIMNRFGLVGSPIRKETKTLKQIGEDLGLTKERIRQLELIALQKLRQSLSSEEFELLTGE